MDFIVIRTSSPHNIQPCSEAVPIETKTPTTGRPMIVWKVQLNTLEDILNFSKKYGELIIDNSYNEGNPSIEIYDDYRE